MPDIIKIERFRFRSLMVFQDENNETTTVLSQEKVPDKAESYHEITLGISRRNKVIITGK